MDTAVRFISAVAVLTLLAACSTTNMKTGDQDAKTVVTGSAGGATSQGASAQLERCDKPLGTLAVVEDATQPWYYQLTNDYKLTSTVPLIRLLVQQSNCFVVVERGKAMSNMMTERSLEQSGELRQGSKFGKGQMVSADYSLNPTITFSNRDAGGIGGALSAFGGHVGAAGALVGGLKFKEASTMLTLVDNRSGVQVAAAEGSSSKADFGAWGGVFGHSAGGSLGGYTNTAEGKVLAASFADSYNQLVRAVRNYRPQVIEGGLGTGGKLEVQGADEAAGESDSTPQKKPAAKTKKKTKTTQ